MNYSLSILTLPIADGPGFFNFWLWLGIRKLYYLFRGKPFPKYEGHHAVTRSVVEGIGKTQLPINYNPRRLCDVSKHVHVLAGTKALQQMIRWKREGLISRLTCGPNIVVRSRECNSILASPEIDAVLNHSRWACDFWSVDHPELKDKCLCWSAGVDTDYWKPSSKRNRSRILLYDKRSANVGPERTSPYIEYLRDSGFAVDLLIYSASHSYKANEYRSLLHQAALMVVFTSGSESQGIAWAEAWAANVPTLILSQTENVISGLYFKGCSTAPFMTSSTGLFFDDFNSFQQVFRLWEDGGITFSPRAWVLENMSDVHSINNLYRLMEDH